MPGLVDAHHADAELAGEPEAELHRRISQGRTELAVGIPNAGGGESDSGMWL
jgi:hypothetical protein